VNFCMDAARSSGGQAACLAMGSPVPHFALSMSTGTLMLCWTLKAVAPRTRSAMSWCPCVLMATKSHPSRSTHLTISLAGSP